MSANRVSWMSVMSRWITKSTRLAYTCIIRAYVPVIRVPWATWIILWLGWDVPGFYAHKYVIKCFRTRVPASSVAAPLTMHSANSGDRGHLAATTVTVTDVQRCEKLSCSVTDGDDLTAGKITGDVCDVTCCCAMIGVNSRQLHYLR